MQNADVLSHRLLIGDSFHELNIEQVYQDRWSRLLYFLSADDGSVRCQRVHAAD